MGLTPLAAVAAATASRMSRPAAGEPGSPDMAADDGGAACVVERILVPRRLRH